MVQTSLSTKLEQSRIVVLNIEEKIASGGGVFARNRDELIRREAELRAHISGLEGLIRQHCGALLPFALVPTLSALLKRKLLAEDKAAQLAAAQDALDQTKDRLKRTIATDEPFRGLEELSAHAKRRIRQQLENIIANHFPVSEDTHIEAIHHVTGSDLQQILRWLDASTQEVPQVMNSTSKELDQLYIELQRVQISLRKIPTDDVLRPLMEELQTSHRQLAEITQRLAAKEEELRSDELELAELQRRHQKTVHELGRKANQQSKARMVPRIQRALEEYQDALLAKKVSELQDCLIECFRHLSRKKDEVRRIAINPRDFSVALFDRQDRQIPKAQLSAGEKQIYSISMLWALAKASRRPLPMIIDTPLGRLDTEHRRLLLKHYFPFASHQVLILSTDTEVDQSYFSELRPTISHSYELEFDGIESSSSIKTGYFWRQTHETHQA